MNPYLITILFLSYSCFITILFYSFPSVSHTNTIFILFLSNSNPILSYPTLSDPYTIFILFVLYSHPVPSYSVPSYPVPSYPVPSYPIPSYPVPSYPVPSYPNGLGQIQIIIKSVKIRGEINGKHSQGIYRTS